MVEDIQLHCTEQCSSHFCLSQFSPESAVSLLILFDACAEAWNDQVSLALPLEGKKKEKCKYTWASRDF